MYIVHTIHTLTVDIIQGVNLKGVYESVRFVRVSTCPAQFIF